MQLRLPNVSWGWGSGCFWGQGICENPPRPSQDFSWWVQGREEWPAAPRRAPRPRHCYPSSRFHPDPDCKKIPPRPCRDISGIFVGEPIISYCPPALWGLACRRFPSFPAVEVGSGRAQLAQNCSLLGRPPLNYLANLCVNEQTLRKLSRRPRQKVTEQACSKVWHSLKEGIATWSTDESQRFALWSFSCCPSHSIS